MNLTTTPLECLLMPGPRPLAPRISQLTKTFWDRLDQGIFVVAQCTACQRPRFPPQGQCPGCGDKETTWQPVNGSGKVYSATVVHAAPAMFAAAAPYVLAVIDLDEGVRLVTRWIGNRPDCDQAARLVVLKYDDGVLFGATAER